MKKSTPPKHKTPNYKLVTIEYRTMGESPRKYCVSNWEPIPLRATRKDLSP